MADAALQAATVVAVATLELQEGLGLGGIGRRQADGLELPDDGRAIP